VDAAAVNIHATAVVVGEVGLLITGPSGSGKSALALAIINACSSHGTFARLVADDRVWITVKAGRVIARAPAPIAGLIEIRGTGVVPLPHIQSAVLHHVLAPLGPERVPEAARMTFQDGVSLPILPLRYGEPAVAIATLATSLGIFGSQSVTIQPFDGLM
jgi:energy-coupling factor transporter ATP-binding protein EcfA2